MAAADAVSELSRVFYVYVHRRATDGSVFYVGKGKGFRAHKTSRNNPHWMSIVAKHGHIVEIVESGLTERVALDREIALIAHYGRDQLCNMTDGGEGISGFVMNAEQRQRRAEHLRAIPRTPERYEKVSAKLKGRPCPEEQKAKISAKLKGQKLSAATRAKMSSARTGHVKRAETLVKLRAAWTDERRAQFAAQSVRCNGRAVVCIETGDKFATMQKARAWCGAASHTQISNACRGIRTTAHGYRWRYAD